MSDSLSPQAEILFTVNFAAEKHRTQKRKDADESPYINHPIAVAKLLSQVGKVSDLPTLKAALLHDTIEDTDTTVDELERKFGIEICNLVMEVTDDKNLPKEERKRLQVEHSPELTKRAKMIKIADKICNILDITHSPPTSWSLERRVEYLDWADKVVAGCRGVNERLERRFDEVMKSAREVLVVEGDELS
jgi:guanosine-3',5'-bis(diphosphate) 3'-pyrophosphohydrolase